MFQRCLVFLLFFNLFLYNVNSQDSFYSGAGNSSVSSGDIFIHTVERGQTVYSISRMYGVSVQAINRLNPGSENGIRIGSELRIPQANSSVIYHTIEPKETLYSVSKKYNVRGEDIVASNPGLSIQTFIIGRTIRIPASSGYNNPESLREEETNALLFRKNLTQRVGAINVAILMPFGTREATQPANLQAKVVEYYEGVLLALDSLKTMGISVNLQVLDIGNDTRFLSQLVQANDLRNSHLLIGGFSDEQIKMLSDFSRQHEIPYVVPFTPRSDETYSNPYLFQINTPSGFLFTKASRAFLNKYRDFNIIFIEEGQETDPVNFVQTLKYDLMMENVPFTTFAYSRNVSNDLEKALSSTKKNVIVPSNAKQDLLNKLFPTLLALKNKRTSNDMYLFGYPEWQTYENSEYFENYFDLNTTIYSNFYLQQDLPRVKNFYNKFYRWYTRPINNSHPKLSFWGYDTAMFFILAVNQHGVNFEEEVNRVKYDGMQTDFYFQRVNNWGGFVNTNVFFVTYNPDFTVSRETR